MNGFPEWLRTELKNRLWKQADLARAANLDTAVVSNLYNGKRGPGEETCRAIARAFDLPVETVYRAAGILPPVAELDALADEVSYLWNRLSEEDQREVLNFLRFKAGAPPVSVPLIYDLFDRLSHQPRRGILFLVQDPDEVHSIMDADQYQFVQHAQIPGQGWIIEAIDMDENKLD